MKARLIAQAAISIAPLQDVVDMYEAADIEANAMISWEKYRIDTYTAEDFAWPK